MRQSITDRKELIDRGHSQISINRQCDLLKVSKGALYYKPKPIDPYTLILMDMIDKQHTETPFYGSRRLTAYLKPVGDKIISSPHNTDAEYTRKRKQTVVGHKAFVTETCDSDNEVQFITDANLETAKHADSKETLKIEERLEDNETKPETLYGDAGFVNGKTILESAEKDIDLAGPSSGRSQSIENFEQDDRPLDTADFEVRIDDNTKELEVLSCPNKQKPLDQQRRDNGHILVHFERETCSQCSMQDRCPVNIGAKISTLTISEEQYAGAARHQQYMEDSDYRQECGIRAGAESLVNEVANGHGARKSRHRAEKRSRLQLIFASIGCNVKRFIRYQVDCVRNQPKMVENLA